MPDSPSTPPVEDPRAALVRLGRLAEALAAELAAEREARRDDRQRHEAVGVVRYTAWTAFPVRVRAGRKPSAAHATWAGGVVVSGAPSSGCGVGGIVGATSGPLREGLVEAPVRR